MIAMPIQVSPFGKSPKKIRPKMVAATISKYWNGATVVEEAEAHPEFAQAMEQPSNSIAGTADQVAAGLDELAARMGAAELMVTIPAGDIADRIDSLQRTTAAWNVPATV